MDRIIAEYAAFADGDLMLCEDRGCAYQADMTTLVPYDDAYFDKYVGYEGAEIAVKLNSGRVSIVNRHVGWETSVLDIGIGSGEFIKSRPNTYGHDVNPKAVEWLKGQYRWAASLKAFMAFTFWDVLEHVPDPNDYFKQIGLGSTVVVSIPIFEDLRKIRESKHYRPNEHLYYFTREGFINWMRCYGFIVQEVSDFESKAGRDDILSFVFVRSHIGREIEG